MASYEQMRDCIAANPDIFDDLKERQTEDFFKWLPDNAHVVNAFGKNAKFLKENGHREYYSAYCIREKLRWDSWLTEEGTDYKISNDITPFVSRLVMALAPSLEGMFKTKSSVELDEPYEGWIL